MTVPPSRPPPARHVTAGGTRVYRVTVPAFPHLSANVHVVVRGDPAAPAYVAVVDVGGSHPDSTAALHAALPAVRDAHGEAVSWADVSRLVITHPHPDHVAGLPFARTLTAAPVAAFHTAAAVIERPQDRRAAQLAAVEAHVTWAGIPPDGEYAARLRRRAGNAPLPHGVPVDTPLHDTDVLDDVFTVIHTPGHEGSQVCLRVDDVLLSADHVLPRSSPPLMPRRVQDGAGVAHYLRSLDRVAALEGVTLALGGHGGPMPEWRARVRQLQDRCDAKLRGALDAAATPVTVHDLTHALHPDLSSVQALLLLDQTGALAEHLAETGRMTETRRADGAAVFTRA